jgi:hypothetical protein
VPRPHHLDEAHGSQIHELLPDSVDLKTYLLNPLSHSTYPSDPSSLEPHYHSLGVLLGRWTRSLHDDPVHQPALAKKLAESSAEAQRVKQHVNFNFAVERAEEFADVLSGEKGGGHAKRVLEEVRQMAARELEGSDLKIIHGDLNPAK